MYQRMTDCETVSNEFFMVRGRSGKLTSRNQIVDQRFFTFEKVFVQNLVPVVAVEYEFILKEV